MHPLSAVTYNLKMDPGAFDDFRDDLREAILQRLDALVPGNSNHLTSTYVVLLVSIRFPEGLIGRYKTS